MSGEAETLTKLGKEALSKGEVDNAVEFFSDALRLKTVAVNGCEVCYDLATYYLNYGDALLRRAEESSELFKGLSGPASHQLDAAGSKVVDNPPLISAVNIESAEFLQDNGNTNKDNLADSPKAVLNDSSGKVSGDKGSSDKISDDKGSSNRISVDKSSSDKVSDDKSSSDKVSDDKGSSDKVLDDKGSSDKFSDNKGSSDKVSDDKGSSDKVSNDKVSDGDILANTNNKDLNRYNLAADNKTCSNDLSERSNLYNKSLEASGVANIESAELTDTMNDDEKQEDSDDEESKEEDVEDEQLAWEVLELARLGFHQLLDCVPAVCSNVSESPYAFCAKIGNEIPTNESSSSSSSSLNSKHMSIKPELLKDEKEIRKAAEDCIFVHLRIGDLMVAEEHFEGAEREYTIAAALGLRFRLNLSAILPAIIARAQTQLYQGRGAEAVVMFKAALEIAEKCLSGTNENASIPSTSNIADYEATIEDLKVQIEETENNIESGMFNGPIVPPEAAETHRQTLIKLAGLDSSKKGFDQSSSELTKEGIVQLGVVKSKRKRDEDESESRVKKAKEGDAKDNNDTA